MNRVTEHIEKLRPRVEALTEEQRTGLDGSLAVAFDEHFAYQQAQAHAHAMGKLSPDEAQVIYVALGEVASATNGGWAANTDLATKVTVTKIVGELLGVRA